MEVIFEQNIEKYDVTFHQETSEITVDILQETVVYETIIAQLGEQGLRGLNGTNGTNGKSAYEIALQNGYLGTEQQWIASLSANVKTNYTHTQQTPSYTWAIQHNLGYIPNIQTFDSAGSEVEGIITHVNINNSIINFDNAIFSGVAYLS
jgi:hypothetical protein